MNKILFDRNIVRKSKIKKSGEFDEEDGYKRYYNNLIKLIPADITAFFLALNTAVQAFPVKAQEISSWISLLIVVIGGLIFQNKFQNVFKFGQFLIGGIAIILWVYIIGGPFAYCEWYNQVYGEALTIVFTFFAPFYNPKK